MLTAAARTGYNCAAVARAAWWWRYTCTGAGVGRRLTRPPRTMRLRPTVEAISGGVEVAGRIVYRDVPRLSHYRVGRSGWSARVKLRPGQTVEDLVKASEALRQMARADVVRVVPLKPGYCTLLVVRSDPLSGRAPWEPAALDSTRLRLAVVDSGAPWIWDLRRDPHMLVTGATNSGKSTFLGSVFTALAPTDAAILGLDMKWAIEQHLWRPRLTALAESHEQATALLDRVLDLMSRRAGVLKAEGLLSVYDLPPGHRARRPVVLIVDELAELLVLAGGNDPAKALKQALAVQLLRVAQLGRAFGVHLVVAAQRFAADIAPAVTAVRAQLGARVVFRCLDAETVKMALVDAAPDAVAAALAIAPELPGCAVVSGGPLGWDRVRGLRPTHTPGWTARQHSEQTPSWPVLLDLDALPVPLPDAA